MDDPLQPAIDILAGQLAAADDDCGEAGCEECNAVRRPIERALAGLRQAAAIRASIAQPEAQSFDHSIGEGRYKVVRGSYWWHVRVGDSSANVGKFFTELAARDMALKLLTAFRDGAFVQYETMAAAQPKPAEPTNSTAHTAPTNATWDGLRWPHDDMGRAVGKEE